MSDEDALALKILSEARRGLIGEITRRKATVDSYMTDVSTENARIASCYIEIDKLTKSMSKLGQPNEH